MRTAEDLERQLHKVLDTVRWVNGHFRAEAQMNAALHMNPNVRPAPLAVAAQAAEDDLLNLIVELGDEARPTRPVMPDDLSALARRLQEATGEDVFMSTQEPWQAKVRSNRPGDKPWVGQEVIAEAPTWADLCDRTRDAIEVRLLNQGVTA